MNQVLEAYRNMLFRYKVEDFRAKEEAELGCYARALEGDPNIIELTREIEHQDREITGLETRVAELEAALAQANETANRYHAIATKAQDIMSAHSKWLNEHSREGSALFNDWQAFAEGMNELRARTWEYARHQWDIVSVLDKAVTTTPEPVIEEACDEQGNHES